MEEITGADYIHSKRICKKFETKILGKRHNLYVQSNALLLADIFNNFRKMCLKIYWLDHAHFFSTPELASQAALKKIKVKLDLIADTNLLLIVENDIRGGVFHDIYQKAKTNNKNMKYYDKDKKCK